MNLFDWLAEQEYFPKVYYCDKESGVERAAVGALRTFDAPPQEAVRCYGGVSFPSLKQGEEWEAFGACRFWQPVQEIVQEAKSVDTVGNRCGVVHSEESVSFDAFAEQIAFLKERIHQGDVDKVVLARKRSLTLEQAPSVWELLPRLKAKSRNATLFAFQMDEENAFFGATPETFFRRKGQAVHIDAVAGSSTAAMGEKEAKEFAYVKQFIQSVAAPFASRFKWNEQEQLLSAAHLHHLHNVAHMDVSEDFSDGALLKQLHPTPAVGGVSTDAALALIRQLEPFERGWYASPVGYLCRDETHLCVALRSALLSANRLHIFAGAGIVADSLAQSEWEEINLKMELILESL